MYAVSIQAHLYHSAACRRLIADQLVSTQPRAPIWAEEAVRRACHRVFVDAHRRGEETRHEIVVARVGATGDDHAAHRNLAQARKIGLHRAHDRLGGNFYQEIKLVRDNVFYLSARAQHFDKAGWNLNGGFRLGGEIHLVPVTATISREQPAQGVKTRLLIWP